MFGRKAIAIIVIVAGCLFAFSHVAEAVQPPGKSDEAPAASNPDSPRLIVELQSPPLSVVYKTQLHAAAADGKLDVNAPDAQAYIAQLQAEQAAFVAAMLTILPQARVTTFTDELGMHESNAYQITFNGLAIDPGQADREDAQTRLAKLPGVKAVYLDRMYQTLLYTSTTLINAPAAWDAVGGRANGGAGVKIASVDAGVHNQAPMFAGTGYAYPDGFGPNGKGLTSNNNGKIIASRAYFRDDDPPFVSSANPWPGPEDSSHGVHTASTAAGNPIADLLYGGLNIGTISGVAPRAYVMSYKVFYFSESGAEGFASAEGIAALEDVVADGADVVNNSWGSGPYSRGGAADPLDQALLNASAAGVFVSMSAGNSGPLTSTSDHPSPGYMTVAASTSGGKLVSGNLRVPATPSLTNIPYVASTFGARLGAGTVTTYPYVTAGGVLPGNESGCYPFPAGPLTGKAVLIRSGKCNFSTKVLNAQDAGAVFVLFYADQDEGDLIAPACYDWCDEIEIASALVDKANGDALVAFFGAQGPAQSTLELTAIAHQVGNQADRIVDFSSRGPGVGNVLKPDIAAPGVNILAQGFADNADGEAVHFGYGQASGTSMAAPHVAGAAAVVRQAYPLWSNAAIKSALMTTAKYLDIYNFDGTPAQPLDMGAGRLDLTHVLDPGVILDPPSLSFGRTLSGTQKTISVTVTSVTTTTESYALSTLYTGAGFTQTAALPGFAVVPALLTLAPGESKVVWVTIDPVASQGYGENQGFVVFDGPVHDAHMPAWARIAPPPTLADVLVIDNDASDLIGFADYRWYYTKTLEQLGLTYAVVNVDDSAGQSTTIPEPAMLAGYKVVLWFTGSNYYANGDVPFSVGLTPQDQYWLLDFLNGGGKLIAMGQDLSWAIGANGGRFSPLYEAGLGTDYLWDSISFGETPQALITSAATRVSAWDAVSVDLSRARQLGTLDIMLGSRAVPTNTSETLGIFQMILDIDRNALDYLVALYPTRANPVTILGAAIVSGTTSTNGPQVRSLLPEPFTPKKITAEYSFDGTLLDLTQAEIDLMRQDQYYVNVSTAAFPAGEVRGWIDLFSLTNQPYVDEIAPIVDEYGRGGRAALRTGDPYGWYGDSVVAVTNRQVPSLELPQIAFTGRSFYAAFGLEGMSEIPKPYSDVQPTTRAGLIQTALGWLMSEPGAATLADTTPAGLRGVTMFTASYSAPANAASALASSTSVAVGYRWDFGDGSPFLLWNSTSSSHVYSCAADNLYTVRVEVEDSNGNTTISARDVDVSASCSTEPVTSKNIYLPLVSKE